MQTHQEIIPPTHAAWPAVAPKDPNELLTTKEAAKELGHDHGTLKNWRSTGVYDLPHIKIGAKVFYRRSVIENAKINGVQKAKPANQLPAH